jgi:hypothetical protein
MSKTLDALGKDNKKFPILKRSYASGGQRSDGASDGDRAIEQYNALLRKGVYPYDYVDNIDKFYD